MRVCIIYPNCYGTKKDAAIIARLLKRKKHRVYFSFARNEFTGFDFSMFWEKARREVLFRIFGKTPYNLNIHVGAVVAPLFSRAELNYADPNQELLAAAPLELLKECNAVLCKTRLGLELYSSAGLPAKYVGWTSPDHLDRNVRRRYDRHLHLASGPLKGTAALLNVWKRHPEWPTLRLVQSPRLPGRPETGIPNIEHTVGFLDDEEVRRLQNECAVHVCPSWAEGWGHYIVEAMSCGAVVITTDGPPMNEHVTRERGLLVQSRAEGPDRWHVNHYVDEDALERAIQATVDMSVQEKERLGANARTWYEKNDAAFRERFMALMDNPVR